MNERVNKCVEGKDILLFKEMLKGIGYDELSVADLISQGIKIVGEAEVTGIWERSEEKGAKCDMQNL